MKDIVTEEDLCEISGHWTREGLKAWLTNNGITFVIAKNGWPRVHRKALERAFGVQHEEKPQVKTFDFNFESLR